MQSRCRGAGAEVQRAEVQRRFFKGVCAGADFQQRRFRGGAELQVLPGAEVQRCRGGAK